MAKKMIEIGGRLHDVSTDHVVAGADEILYEPTNGTPKKQSEVNVETYELAANINAALQELSPDQTAALALATDVNDLKDNVVRSDVQTLTDAQKAQALANVGISGIEDAPTAGSEKLVKSGGVQNELALGAVYDVSAKNPTAGLNNDGKWESLSALLSDANLSTLIPTAVRKGGMSIKFIQSSDNKYIQARLTADSFTTDVTQWQGVDEKPTAGSKNLVESGGVAKINGYNTETTEYIRAYTDKRGKFLFGIKTNGEIEWSKGIPTPIKELLDGKADKEEGKSLINEEYANSQSITYGEDWVKAITDKENKLLFGINHEGEIRISKFDEHTKNILHDNQFPELISIPIFNSVSNFPFTTKVYNGDNEDTSVIGLPNAKYVMELPLSDDAFNIRFDFMVTENLINQNKTAVIANFGGNNIITATPTALSQYSFPYTIGGVTKRSYWPLHNGGVSYTGLNLYTKRNTTGEHAFSIQYTGEGTSASVTNTGSALLLNVDGTVTTLSFTDYPKAADLYDAVKAISGFSVSYNALEGRLSTELAIFTETQLISSYYSGTDGTQSATMEEYTDAAPLMLRYAFDTNWHRVEIVKIGSSVYVVVDGEYSIKTVTNKTLILGGNCDVLFRNFEIRSNSSYDAEIVSNRFVSSKNPHIVIHEGHGMQQIPSHDAVTTDNMRSTIDRLQAVFSALQKKGYIPVTIYDIVDYYYGKKELPKRCYVSIFDDYQYANCLLAENRAVFEKFQARPALAIISGNDGTIEHNGQTITKKDAAAICRMSGFDLVSHTRNHRYCTNIKPSEYKSEFVQDIYSGDDSLIDSTILVYPYGASNPYLRETLEYAGCRIGINVDVSSSPSDNFFGINRFNLTREEIGMRISLDNILSKII